MRLSNEELEQVKEKYHVDELWSYSRLDTFRTSPYLFFLKYIKHEKPLKDIVSPYGIIGGACHETLEKYYKGDIKYSDMLNEFQTAYTMQIELFDLKFNVTDENMNKSIARKYKTDLEHFFANYKPVEGKHKMEQFVSMEVQSGIAIGGYIDDVIKEEDGTVHIYDFKTSSKSGFTGDRLREHSHQLVIYAEALRQAGVPQDKIAASFLMMKYVDVDITQKNGKIKTSTIERCQIGEKLQSKASVWLKETGLSEEEQNELLAQMIQDNSIDCLPDSVKEKFVIRDCYIDVPDIFGIYDELRLEIIDIVADIDNRKHEYDETHDDHVWYDTDESMEKNSYFLVQISEYRIDQIRCFAEYCERLEREEDAKREASDLLGITRKEKANEEDLSWLDDLT